MKQVAFHYGHGKITHSFSEELVGVLESAINTYTPPATDKELIEQAMAAPIACSPLSALAKGKDKIVIIASDHTRPVPSKLIIPPMLQQLRQGNPDADITILDRKSVV